MLLFVVLVCMAALINPAEACSPSNAVVAVVSVVSTLVVIAIILVVIYFILRRRRNKETYLKTQKVSSPTGDVTDGYVNAGFHRSNPSLAEEGLITIDRKGPKQGKKKNGGGKDVNAKTWSSFPEREQPGLLYRPGSCGSLDDNMQSNAEIMTVCLESQDIIGLGFNISGNFGEGIQVSQVHNRGPAVESGNIKVGDKILSVEVSYENIVYEDALTILSYASPYPVKITLQKNDVGRSRDSTLYKKEMFAVVADEKLTTQLNHPLYRSQSLDAFKHLGKSKDSSGTVPFQPKRTQSEMKPETRKDAGKNRRKGDRNSKSFVHDVLDKIAGTISPSKSSSSKQHEVVVSDVVVHQETREDNPDRDIQLETFPPNGTGQDDTSDDFTPTNSVELATLMDDRFDLKHNNDGFENVPLHTPSEGSPALPPSKPERKNKKQDSFDSHKLSSESLNMDTSEEPVNSDVEEDTIIPCIKKIEKPFGNGDIQLEPLEFHPPVTGKYEDMEEALSPLANVQIISVNIDRSPSPDDNVIVEELIEASEAKRDSSAMTLSALEKKDTKDTINENKATSEIGINTESFEHMPHDEEEKPEEKTEPPAPALDEQMLERLIAMNSYEPGTQGWAGIEAGGNQGGIEDDFVPSNSKKFVPQPVHNKNLNDGNFPSSRPMSPPSLAYEIRDNISGSSVVVGYKSKSGSRDSSPATSTSSAPTKHNKNTSNVKDRSSGNLSGVSSPTNIVNKSYNAINHNNKSNNNNNKKNNSNSSSRNSLSQDIIDTSSHDLTNSSFKLVVNSDNNPELGSKTDWREPKPTVDNNQIVNSSSYDRCIDDLTDSDSECAMSENPSRMNSSGSKDISNRISKLADNSDVSNSFTSSSGEATPPYSSNGQELGSSPEFSVSKSPLELMSSDMNPDSKSNPSISLNLHRNDEHSGSDAEC